METRKQNELCQGVSMCRKCSKSKFHPLISSLFWSQKFQQVKNFQKKFNAGGWAKLDEVYAMGIQYGESKMTCGPEICYY